jgi:hypothetical protein
MIKASRLRVLPVTGYRLLVDGTIVFLMVYHPSFSASSLSLIYV